MNKYTSKKCEFNTLQCNKKQSLVHRIPINNPISPTIKPLFSFRFALFFSAFHLKLWTKCVFWSILLWWKSMKRDFFIADKNFSDFRVRNHWNALKFFMYDHFLCFFCCSCYCHFLGSFYCYLITCCSANTYLFQFMD